MKECAVCLTDHDPEIHEATESLHAWWREKIGRIFRPVEFKVPPVPAGNAKETIGVIDRPKSRASKKPFDRTA